MLGFGDIADMLLRRRKRSMRRVCCSRYTDKDDAVMLKASSLGMPLIGGTALEVWAGYYSYPGVRKRSDNDLDFVTNSTEDYVSLSDWCRAELNPDEVKVDVMLVQSHELPSELICSVGGVLVMAPEYLVWMKMQRRSGKDTYDIKWLLRLIYDEGFEDSLERWLSELGVTEFEMEYLNDLIEEINEEDIECVSPELVAV